MEKDYEYPYGDMQTHEALEDLDRRLKALEPKTTQKTTQPKLIIDPPASHDAAQ